MKKWIALVTLGLFLWLIPAYAEGMEIAFSHDSGFYSNSISLEITCSDRSAKIYYTLDGSIPTEESKLYSDSLYMMYSSICQPKLMMIEGTKEGEQHVVEDRFPMAHVVRAMAVNNRGERSEVISGTYFVGYDRTELYGETPIMLLVTDPANLFDYERGIYILGKCYDDWIAEQENEYDEWNVVANFTQRGKEWERPVSVTLLPSEGEGFSQEMGMRIKGKSSRIHAQKSLRLIAREEYGKKNVKFEVFPDNIREEDGRIVDKYKSFTLRIGDQNNSRIRDPLIANVSTGLRFETAQNMPCIAFLNGEFWGLYTLNEEYTDNYIQYHYGIDNDNVITVKLGQIEDGEDEDIELFKNMGDYIIENDMAEDEHYEAAKQLLDMGSFADYCALQFYIFNEDGCFKNNNWQMWRVRDPKLSNAPFADGKWRMMLFDSDYTSGVYCSGKNASEDNVTPVITRTNYQGRTPAHLLVSLLKNDSFKQELLQAFCDVRNLYFAPERINEHLTEMSKQYLPYAPDTLRRFGPSWVLNDPEEYVEKQLGYLQSYFVSRYDTFLPILQNAFGLQEPCQVTIDVSNEAKGEVYLNGRSIPVDAGETCLYFPEYALTVEVVPAEGRRFTGWTVTDGNVNIAELDALTAELTFQEGFTLVANFE